MFRAIAPFALLLAAVSVVHAQDKPTPAVQAAVAGTWRVDPSKSDSIPADPAAMTGGGRALGMAGGAGGARGGGGGGGSGRSRRASTPVAVGTGDSAAAAVPDRPAERGGDPHVAMVLHDLNPGVGMVVAVNDSAITMANAKGEQSSFKTDGRKRQSAQMDGSIYETQALWKDDVLQVTTGVAGVGSVKREFKPSKDGKSLELKVTLDLSGRKMDKKLVFNRQ